LWVDSKLRSQGHGKRLLNVVEQEAIKNGCHLATTNTWDFQAEEFYLKSGYTRIGEIKNYWKGHSMIFLRKDLKSLLDRD
jgi:ribosomal protein S18 acetylase RimI-like enzyme